ncbi:uncharacterized protein with von Willebrand factor type A (vWA) domain [Streptacidiphilus sp. MAP12-16]|uniref:vWA domain-containing protein n=1 Tax=Streptacidiphilus sp. MAP12-16 TaxID=3156300 RepID=UPI0035199166
MGESYARPPAFDQPSFAGRFGEALHRAGVPVTPERSVRFLDALTLLPPVDRTTLYWAARLAFVTGLEQIEPFNRVFRLVFGNQPDRIDARDVSDQTRVPGPEPVPGTPPPDSAAPPRPSATQLPSGDPHPDATDNRSQRSSESGALRLLGSSQERLAHKDFRTFEPSELAELDRLLDTLVLNLPLRRTRRRQADPRGRHVDLRRTLRRSLRTGGEAVRLARSHGRQRHRPLVLLCDISGSMEPYAHAYLRFFSRVCSRAGAGLSAETFVFATRLTRLTPVLRHSTPDTALHQAGRTATDWSGGTRIAHALTDFTDRFGRRGMARGAVLVIFSDGWEGENPAAVGQQMARLTRLAHRIIWVNPRKAAPGYAPLAAGMAAALPYCDAFVSGHSLAALGEVVDAIAAPDHHQPGGRGRRRLSATPAERR